MRISLARGITTGRRRIFFLSVCFCDRRGFDDVVALPNSRVDTLRLKSYADSKKHNCNCGHSFQRFCFHMFVSVKISQLGTQTDAWRGKFKKDLNNCTAIRPAFSSLLKRYSFSKTRNLSSSIRRSRAR